MLCTSIKSNVLCNYFIFIAIVNLVADKQINKDFLFGVLPNLDSITILEQNLSHVVEFKQHKLKSLCIKHFYSKDLDRVIKDILQIHSKLIKIENAYTTLDQFQKSL